MNDPVTFQLDNFEHIQPSFGKYFCHGPVGGRQSRAHGRALAHVIVPIRRVLRKELSQKISFSELGFSSDDILYIFASEIFILRTISEEIFK